MQTSICFYLNFTGQFTFPLPQIFSPQPLYHPGIGGKQYRVSEGDILNIEKLDVEAGSEVVFDEVLTVVADSDVKIGKPVVDGAKVTAKVVEHGKAEKIFVFKYKAKSNYRKRQGHRQPFTKVEISKIEA